MAVDIVLGTVGEFIEISQTVVAIFIIYYLIKFIFYSPKGADAKWNARGAAGREAVGKLLEERKKKKEKREKLENRKKHLEKCLGYLHRALSASQELQERLHNQKKGEINKTKQGIGSLKSALSSARSSARVAHHYNKDELTESIYKIHASIDAVFEKIDELLIERVPKLKSSKDEFKEKSKEFRSGAKKMADYLVSLYSSVSKYIQTHDDQKLQLGAEIENLERQAASQHAVNQGQGSNSGTTGGSGSAAAPRSGRLRLRRGNPPTSRSSP
jgi:hypothetical protein